ncbi:MAG TPA: division/cell wall cluster transcriptional repressor MraZ [Flavobacteriales bacterium]|nr:division/cell wall cluster transcriptional repressor MraZ [Flavobacteriales bacterium]HQW85973.1 division/cell wall cluster transcriptional repressor MraZ [Flavobacteriales bacterium]
MLNLLGEYDLRLDAKGRLVLPSGLKRQLAEVATKGFVIARDVFKPCLVLYPMSEWERTQAMMARLNPFVEKNREFIRRFTNGATRVELDGSDRILLPKPLMDHAGIGKDLKLMGLLDRVELWSREGHARMQREAVDLTALAEEVMGSLGNANGQ